MPDEIIFRGKSIPHRNAIVITGEMDKDKIATAPSFECMTEVQATYADTGTIVTKIAGYLRRRGYAAVPCHSLGGVVDLPALAQHAGMGAHGRHGLLISKKNGASQRIAAVFTDIENLPLCQSSEYEWIPDFCATCGRCIRSCPVQALYEEKQLDEWGQFTTTDGDKCILYFARNYGCSICIKVCPFTTKGYEAVRNIADSSCTQYQLLDRFVQNNGHCLRLYLDTTHSCPNFNYNLKFVLSHDRIPYDSAQAFTGTSESSRPVPSGYFAWTATSG